LVIVLAKRPWLWERALPAIEREARLFAGKARSHSHGLLAETMTKAGTQQAWDRSPPILYNIVYGYVVFGCSTLPLTDTDNVRFLCWRIFLFLTLYGKCAGDTDGNFSVIGVVESDPDLSIAD
jgi:hypothetical protein